MPDVFFNTSCFFYFTGFAGYSCTFWLISRP
jgi:hypothetical protein